MASRFTFTPESASFPSNGFAVLKKESVASKMYIAFTDAGSNVAYWNAVAPENFAANAAGNISLHITYFMGADPGSAGNVLLWANVEAPVYNTELANANLFATVYANVLSNVANIKFSTVRKIIMDVPADGLQASSYFRIRLERVGQNTSDTATGDFNVLAIEMKDSV